jgi:hypothetical protein
VPSEIIGVVGDVKQKGFDNEAGPMAYWPIPKSAYFSMTFVIRTKGESGALVPAARDVIRSIDAQQPAADERTLESLLGNSIVRQRFNTLLLAVFAMVAYAAHRRRVAGLLAACVAGGKCGSDDCPSM